MHVCRNLSNAMVSAIHRRSNTHRQWLNKLLQTRRLQTCKRHCQVRTQSWQLRGPLQQQACALR